MVWRGVGGSVRAQAAWTNQGAPPRSVNESRYTPPPHSRTIIIVKIIRKIRRENNYEARENTLNQRNSVNQSVQGEGSSKIFVGFAVGQLGIQNVGKIGFQGFIGVVLSLLVFRKFFSSLLVLFSPSERDGTCQIFDERSKTNLQLRERPIEMPIAKC